MQHQPVLPPVSRREALKRIGGGFGMLSFANMLAASASAPLEVKAPHFPPKAKRVIFLVMNGGMSQVDTFDPKPMLDKFHGQRMPGGNLKTERQTGNLMRSPFRFQKYGQSGIEVSEIFPHIGKRIDDTCVIRSMHTDIPNHEPSLYMLNCGENLVSRPSLGDKNGSTLRDSISGTNNTGIPAGIAFGSAGHSGGCPTHPRRRRSRRSPGHVRRSSPSSRNRL
jgi:hypothetical protein